MRQVTVIALVALCAHAAFAEGIRKENVALTTSDGVAISGYFVKGAAPKGPAVVLLHMLGRTKEDWDPIIEKYLGPETGFCFLAIDLRGHGQSVRQGEKVLNRKEFSEKDLDDMAGDIGAAVKWLKTRPEVDPDKIGILGASIAANLALVFASQDTTIKAVGLLSPSRNYRGAKTIEAMKAYGKRPVFMAVASEDMQSVREVPWLQKQALGEEVTRVFDGNLHGTRMFAAYPLDKPLTDFLKKHLG